MSQPKLCPHCGKPIRQAQKPRDLGLLLHVLTYYFPLEQEIGEAEIERARQHCKMKQDRLALFQSGPYRRFWEYMEEKRTRRREWAREHGQVPPFGWTPPKEGEPDRTNAIAALKRYRKTLAREKARYRRNPQAQTQKLVNRLKTYRRRFRSTESKLQAIEDLEARLAIQVRIEEGDLPFREYNSLRSMTLPDDQYKRRKRGSEQREESSKTASGT